MTKQPTNWGNWGRKAARLALAIAALAALGWLLLDVLESLGGASGIHRRFGYASLLVLLPLYLTPPIPGEIAGMITVSIYGFALGAPLLWCGLIVRAVIEYRLSGYLLADPGGATGKVKTWGWLERFPAHHPVFLVAGRWMPLGNHIVSVFAGMRSVPFWRFVWTSALGLAPFALLVSAGAAGLVAAHG